ncbi:DUF4439 domain-containing protein [Cellulosimicrobium sp. CUA-896]|uniref:DUF4439 domain-containing protein n=1 Tax=Cellulosimicrobium sp. CUA-896 TaxID=1517881 RepID=UPI00096A70F8|nr:DUF4439 domain-containing protein [Cellulosimicrobium sp. CUA-896]
MRPHATAADAAHPARAALAAVLVVVAAVLAGCGVRLETPAPTEPSPGAREVVRRTAVDDALTVAGLADEVAPSAADPAVRALVDEIAAFAREHVDALGGVYDSGLPDPGETAGATAGSPTEVTTTPADAAAVAEGARDAGADAEEAPDTEDAPDEEASDAGPTTDDVVAALVGAAQRTRASADAARDPGLARLLASVATSEHVSAQRLAAATGSDAAAELTLGTALVGAAPTGVGAADLATLVAAEDAAGYAYEVRGAQADGDVRAAAVARAAQHRARAEAWARAAGTDGTDQDPRRVAYELPEDEDTAALAQRLESELAQSYASLVATSAPTSRGEVLVLLVDSWQGALAWGAPLAAFPGLPEQAGAAPAGS